MCLNKPPHMLFFLQWSCCTKPGGQSLVWLQVDFEKEAQHIAHFAAYLDTMGMNGIATCPHVYTQFSSRRVLVMERLDGVSLTDLQVCKLVVLA